MISKPLSIIFPTRNRREKLREALTSIQREEAGPDGILVVVICDADPETAASLLTDKRVDRVIYTREHRGSVFCRNLATASTDGPLIYATDDIVFKPGAIAAAMAAMAAKFPDGDGVVGFYRGETKHSPTAMALVGQEFLRRYPGKKLFYPGYFHFSCQEIDFAASKINKLFVCREAEAGHTDPRQGPSGLDSTHFDARTRRVQDLELSHERQAKNLIWGLTDFEVPR